MAFSERLKDTQIIPGVLWSDVWSRREVFAMVPLEEALFKNWHFDRLVCIGDSMLKVVPTAPLMITASFLNSRGWVADLLGFR
jgi:hypothetical protein